MGRYASVRWDDRKQAWVSECGDLWVDAKNRRRRREVAFAGISRSERPEALRAMLDFVRNRDACERDPGAWTTVDQVVQAWLEWSESHRKPRTYQGHREVAKLWLNYAPGGTPLRERLARSIDSPDLKGLVDSLQDRGLSPHYVARVSRSVKACWAWAAEPDRNRSPERLIPTDPLASVRSPRVPASPERYAEWSEVAAFFRFCWRRSRASTRLMSRFGRLHVLMMRFIAMTGCRPDEAAQATWSSIHWERRTITLDGKTTGVTGRKRVVFLSPRCLRLLRAIERLPGRHSEYVFTHKRGRFSSGRGADDPMAGEPWRDKSLQHRVCQLRDEAIAAGVSLAATGPNAFTLYRLRHTRISDDLMAGGRIGDVAAIHGTSARMIDQVYGHLLHEHLASVADDLVSRRRVRQAKSLKGAHPPSTDGLG